MKASKVLMKIKNITFLAFQNLYLLNISIINKCLARFCEFCELVTYEWPEP
jgi:hypothetical protein